MRSVRSHGLVLIIFRSLKRAECGMESWEGDGLRPTFGHCTIVLFPDKGGEV